MSKSISTTVTEANIASILKILETMPNDIDQLTRDLSPDALMTPLAPGERTPTEVLAHIINCEERTSESICLALLLNGPLIHPVHPERQWGKLLQREQFAFIDLLAYFRLRRRLLINVLGHLSEAQWKRTIREEGKQRQESVYWLARSHALHELEHYSDLAHKLPQGK